MLDIETLFEQYRNDVYRLALSYTKSVQEAEDVCQTVFLKLMKQKSIPSSMPSQSVLQKSGLNGNC
mgnify:CR=1 FL=1